MRASNHKLGTKVGNDFSAIVRQGQIIIANNICDEVFYTKNNLKAIFVMECF